jgi:hypothetical protein
MIIRSSLSCKSKNPVFHPKLKTSMILGSKSSKCTEIKTPVDPHKIRFIDNKRISIIIGCVAGILVFIFIIISIVMNREDKEEEAENENESLSGSAATAHKSPGK